MIVTRRASTAFTLEFEDEQELRAEHGMNLSQGALRLPTSETAPLYTAVTMTLRGPWGGEASLRATVVAALADGLALAIEGYTDETLGALLVRPFEKGKAHSTIEDSTATPDEPGESKKTVWDRLHGLSQTEKLLLAVKADRPERALLLQDNDPRVLLSLLRNPRIGVEEVARMAKSPFLSYQVADVIMKSALWMGNSEVRIGLVHNPKTPQAFALRILPTLSDSDLRGIARAGTSMALKQAALKRLQGK